MRLGAARSDGWTLALRSRRRPSAGACESKAFDLIPCIAPRLIYPFWHLAAPADAIDPWAAWWAVAGCFIAVDLLARVSATVDRQLVLLLHLCAFLPTFQLYVLSYLNDMQAFYVVGSAMSVLSVSIRSRAVHLGYAAFLVVLTGVLFALGPDSRKAAYWGGMLTIVAASYFRLSGQLTAAQLTHERQEWLEERVRERTVELSSANQRLRAEMEQRGRLEDELRVSNWSATRETVKRIASRSTAGSSNRCS